MAISAQTNVANSRFVAQVVKWLGILVIIIEAVKFYHAITSLNWPSVNGEVTNSYISIDRASKHIDYLPNVYYKYAVNGTQYKGHRL